MSGPPHRSQEDIEAERLAARELLRRRARPMRRAAPTVGRTIAARLMPKLDKSGAGIAALQERWPEIVGPRLGGLSRPVRIVGGKTGRTLVIEAPSAAAPMIQHQASLIIERAQMGGAGKLKSLRVQQTRTPAKTTKASAKRKRQRELSPARREELETYLQDVEDTDIRAALFRLGEAILTRR